MGEDLLPFYTCSDLYLKPIHKISITVTLPKLRQVGQSVSNWEIRERLKKMLNSIEMADFKVIESTLEEVQFAAVVNTEREAKLVIKTLDGITFRAVGFNEPLSVTAAMGKTDFPTRVDWDKFFAESTAPSSSDGERSARPMAESEREPGERPDTVYLGGLPFEWFKSPLNENMEKTMSRVFAEYGDVRHVDIPQCDPYRKQMDSDIAGIHLSSWSCTQEPFFEVYVMFAEYAGFVNAMSALCGKILVQKIAGGQLREAKIKVDFDRTAHLSHRKIIQRCLRRACIESNKELKEAMKNQIDINEAENYRKRKEKEQELSALAKRQELTRQLLRAEKRQKLEFQKNYEHVLRKKLEVKMTKTKRVSQEKILRDRERGAKALLEFIATLHRAQIEALKYSTVCVSDLASEYAKGHDLPEEEEMRSELLRRQELKLRTRIAERMLVKKQQT